MTREQVYSAVTAFVAEQLADAAADDVANTLLGLSIGLGVDLVGRDEAAKALMAVAVNVVRGASPQSCGFPVH